MPSGEVYQCFVGGEITLPSADVIVIAIVIAIVAGAAVDGS